MLAINCVPVDCQYLERCPVCRDGGETPNLHFEIPQIVTEFGDAAIAYLGSTDRQKEFDVYMTSNYTNKYHAYRKRGKRNPYVYIDPVPNKNNMFDGWVFNAPFLKTLSIVAVFKDMR